MTGKQTIRNNARVILKTTNEILATHTLVPQTDPKILLWQNRKWLEALFPQYLSPISIRMNRTFLETQYPQYLVKNLYDAELSYEKMAKNFAKTKSSIQKAMQRGSKLYREIFCAEVSRYTQDENIEEEIEELMQILAEK